jgi:large subunit ribosomal protein L4
MKLNIYNQKGEVKGDMEVSAAIFGVKVNTGLVNEAIVAQMANERQVLAHTKTRSEVRGGGKKPWRQKGTGRARAGSSRSPLWIGGGIIFGPNSDRNFSKKINKQAKRKAMFMVLSDRAANDGLAIIEKLSLDNFKTKVMDEILNNLETKVFKNFKIDEKKKSKNKQVRSTGRSILLINDASDAKVINSSRNLAGIKIINLDNINIVDLLNFRNIVIADKAIEKLESIYKK